MVSDTGILSIPRCLEIIKPILKKKEDAGIDIPFGSELVLAFIKQESEFNPYAVRYELRYRWTVVSKRVLEGIKPGISDEHMKTELQLQKFSWGLMQVMGAVARERKFKGWLTELTDPVINIVIGIDHLLWFASRYQKVSDIISSYNQGSPRKSNGLYRNQEYVDSVLGHAERYKNDA